MAIFLPSCFYVVYRADIVVFCLDWVVQGEDMPMYAYLIRTCLSLSNKLKQVLFVGKIIFTGEKLNKLLHELFCVILRERVIKYEVDYSAFNAGVVIRFVYNFRNLFGVGHFTCFVGYNYHT